jgi:hypothetical protein
MIDPYVEFWGSDEHADIDYGVFPRARMHRKGWDQRLAALRVGRHICFGKGGGGGNAPTPDPQIGQAALQEAQTGQHWLDFATQQFNIGNARQSELDDLTKQVTQQQLGTQAQQNQWAQQDRARYTGTFEPLQDQYIQQAKDYNTPAKQQEMAAEAVSDQQQAARQANDANTRSMASMGINPASGRFQGITRAQNTLNSLNAAGAANNARQAVRDKGLALEADAINMGNGLPTSAASSAGIGLNAGNSAVGNAGAANANWRSNVGIMGQGYSGAMQGYQGQGSLLNSEYGNQLAGWSAQQQASSANSAGLMGGIGSIAGAGIMAF